MKRRFLLAFLVLMTGIWVVSAQQDIVPQGAPTNANANITWPPPVYTLRGDVPIRGTANVSNMANYFIEFRPLILDAEEAATTNTSRPWFPATLPTNQTVSDNVLGTWNTNTTPDGLYEIRLTINITGGQPQFYRVSPLRVENNPPDFVQVVQPRVRPTLPPTPTPLPGGAPARPTLGATSDFVSGTPIVIAQTDSNVRSGDSTAYERIGALLQGQSAQILGVSSTGSGWYYIELDTGRRGYIAPSIVRTEGNLSNLQRYTPPPVPTATFTPTPPASGNLVISGFRLDPSQPVCGQMFEVLVNITNAGSGTTSGPATVLVRDIYPPTGAQQASGTYTVPRLDPGQNWVAVVEMTVTTYFEQEHRLAITVDSGNQVAETNESDNSINRTYTLAQGSCG